MASSVHPVQLLHDDGRGRAAAVADGRDAVLARLQLVQQGGQDARAGAAQGVAQGDGAAEGVDAGALEAEDPLVGPDDGGKGLVELPHGDLLLGYARALQRDRHRLGRRDGEVDGVDGGVSGGHDARERALAGAELAGEGPVGKDERGRAVVHGGRVASGDGAGAVLEEGGLQGPELVDVEVLVSFIAVDDDALAALLARDRDGGDLIREAVLLPGLLRALVRADGVLVLLLARDAVLLGRLLGADAHVDLVVHVPQPVLDQAVLELDVAEGRLLAGPRQVVRHARHVLHAARHLGLRQTQLDVLRRQHHRLQARGADLVHRHGLDGLRQPGEDGRLAGGRLAHGGLQDVAHVHVADPLDGNARLLDGGLDGDGAELWRGDGDEGAIELGQSAQVKPKGLQKQKRRDKPWPLACEQRSGCTPPGSPSTWRGWT